MVFSRIAEIMVIFMPALTGFPNVATVKAGQVVRMLQQTHFYKMIDAAARLLFIAVARRNKRTPRGERRLGLVSGSFILISARPAPCGFAVTARAVVVEIMERPPCSAYMTPLFAGRDLCLVPLDRYADAFSRYLDSPLFRLRHANYYRVVFNSVTTQ